MPRHVNLPGADELFRPTQPTIDEAAAAPAPARKWTTRRKAVVPPFEEALPPSTPVPVATKPAATPADAAPEPADEAPATARRKAAAPSRKPAAPKSAATGRVRHDEKITVYVSTEELLALETGRLSLRGEHGLAVDRGRIVRESIAIVMADLAAHGADSELVRRLRSE